MELLMKSEELETSLNSRMDKLFTMIESIEKKCDFNKRLVEVERKISLADQYERRDCIEVVGIPSDVPQEELEGTVIAVCALAGVQVVPRDIQACHRLKGKQTVITKFTNRKDVQSILREKKKLRNIDEEGRNMLNINDDVSIYINESLCGPFRYLLGLCNVLFKRKTISGFWTTNGVLKIKLFSDDPSNEGVITSISHVEDLNILFGHDLVAGLFKK